MADRETLRAAGFQRLSLESTPVAQPFVDTVGGWRRYADYRVLYEFDYQSTDGVQSLIVRIPINIDSGLDNQSMIVTDAMTRWDSTKAPGLVVRGASSIG